MSQANDCINRPNLCCHVVALVTEWVVPRVISVLVILVAIKEVEVDCSRSCLVSTVCGPGSLRLNPIIPTSLVIVIITPIIDNMHDCMIVKEVIAIFSMHRC